VGQNEVEMKNAGKKGDVRLSARSVRQYIAIGGTNHFPVE
jgi:hypothetical protein